MVVVMVIVMGVSGGVFVVVVVVLMGLRSGCD